jgi:hypothetical protein
MKKTNINLVPIKFIADTIVLHKTYIKNGIYEYKDPTDSNQIIILEIDNPRGINLKMDRKITLLASDENLFLSTFYRLSCNVFISDKINLFPSLKNNIDWPKTSEGRSFLENTFLEKINFFFDNIVSLSSKMNPNHNLLNSIRPIGSEDIIFIQFSLQDKVVAIQGNPILTRLMSRIKDHGIWPETTSLTKSFSILSSEEKLLHRSCALVRFGFYQEAFIVAFSVLDAKVQELIKDRLEDEFLVDRKEVNNYLMNISQHRLDTLLNFLFKILDKSSIKAKETNLSKQIDIINSKRNRIIHNGEEASKEEAKNAILTIAKTLDHLNKYHKGNFNIPSNILDNSKSWLLF